MDTSAVIYCNNIFMYFWSGFVWINLACTEPWSQQNPTPLELIVSETSSPNIFGQSYWCCFGWIPHYCFSKHLFFKDFLQIAENGQTCSYHKLIISLIYLVILKKTKGRFLVIMRKFITSKQLHNIHKSETYNRLHAALWAGFGSFQNKLYFYEFHKKLTDPHSCVTHVTHYK